MIQLQKSGAIVDQDEVARLKSAFARANCVLIPGLLDAAILNFLLPRAQQRRWVQRIDKDIATEEVLDDALALELLHFVTNTPGFLAAVSAISGGPALNLFRGRIYRLLPHSAQYDSWHDDIGDELDRRAVGMSINLGARQYAGGAFQLRDFSSKQMLFEAANTGWGDAILFRLSLGLEHRVTAVTGNEPRIAYAGWFRSDAENFYSALRRVAALGS